MQGFVAFLGLIVMMVLAWLFSPAKRQIPWRVVIGGLTLQLLLGVLILKSKLGRLFFDAVRVFVTKLVSFSDKGAEFVFGENFQEHFYAFSVVSTIIFISALMSLFFYWGIIQKFVGLMAKLMTKIMDVSGVESLAASANIFVGQTEAPLVVKPYMKTMTQSELLCLMVGGMASVAGSTLAAYASLGANPGHLVSASFMSAPAALLIAKLMFPELQSSATKGNVSVLVDVPAVNAFDALCKGAGDGLKLALNVVAMLIAFVAVAALINYFLALFPEIGGESLSVERILGWLFAPLAFLMSIPRQEMFEVGSLLGTKMFLNEFVAYMQLQEMSANLSERSVTIATYALCGFANFSSIAIQIGGLGALVPERRQDFARFGLRAMLGGTLAANMTACMAGILL